MGENAFLYYCQEEDEYPEVGPICHGSISTEAERALLQPSPTTKRTANKDPVALAGQAIAEALRRQHDCHGERPHKDQQRHAN